jgi:hypothetical protein
LKKSDASNAVKMTKIVRDDIRGKMDEFGIKLKN